MGMMANVIAVLMAASAFAVVLTNAYGAYRDARNRRLGIARHVSGVPVIAQVLVLLAAMANGASPAPWLPAWLLWGVALSDVALWRLVYMLLRLATRR